MFSSIRRSFSSNVNLNGLKQPPGNAKNYFLGAMRILACAGFFGSLYETQNLMTTAEFHSSETERLNSKMDIVANELAGDEFKNRHEYTISKGDVTRLREEIKMLFEKS